MDVISTEYGTLSLNDYEVVNDFKSSWQDEMPPDNSFELGWLGVVSSWLFESNDSKIWYHEEDDLSSDFPPFDENSTWYNRDNSTETIVLYMTCDPAYNGTDAPDVNDSICECINSTSDGLSAVEGVYEYDNDTLNDGADYYRPKDMMRCLSIVITYFASVCFVYLYI